MLRCPMDWVLVGKIAGFTIAVPFWLLFFYVAYKFWKFRPSSRD